MGRRYDILVGDYRELIEEPEDDEAPIDPEAEQRVLKAAGWERVYRQGKLLWRHPESDQLYPQGPAMRRLEWDSRGGEGGQTPEAQGR